MRTWAIHRVRISSEVLSDELGPAIGDGPGPSFAVSRVGSAGKTWMSASVMLSRISQWTVTRL